MAAERRSEVVVITGASAGVGRATARAYAQEGARIGLIARGKDRLEATRREVESLGGQALVLPTDVADADAVEAAADAVEREFGPIDIWVNNAMVSVFSPAKQMTADEYKRVTEVTYLGYVYGTLSALRRMLPRDRGVIVQVGSALAYRGIPLQSAYCGSKHAIEGFTESVRCELIHDGSHVKITMVQLPAVNTPQFNWVRTRLPRKPQPVPPVFQPEVIADAIVYASRHYRREWYIGGMNSVIIAGNKLAPGLGDWYLAKTGYDSQQYDGAVEPDRPDNLYDPPPGDYGAHGIFDHMAKDRSFQVWLSRNRDLVAAGLGIAALVGAAVVGQALSNGRSHDSLADRARELADRIASAI